MRAREIEISRNITLALFWFNLVKRLTPYFIGCVLGGITSGAVFKLTDAELAFKITAYFQIALAAVLIPAFLILWSVNKRHMAVIASDAVVRNSVADYLVNNITAHRYGYNNFYMKMLIKTGDGRITDCLGILLKSISPDRRQYAVKTLGSIGGEKAIGLLKAAVDDKNYDVSEEAKKEYSNLINA